MGGSPGELSEELVTQEKRKKGLRMNCDVGKATEGLENDLCSTVYSTVLCPPFRHFTYSTAHSLTLPSLHLRQSLSSDPFVASPTSQLILQPFFRFSYVTVSSLMSPGEPTIYCAPVQCSGPQSVFPICIWIVSLGEGQIQTKPRKEKEN